MSTSATGPSGAKDAAEQRESRKTSRNAEGGVVTGLIAGTCRYVTFTLTIASVVYPKACKYRILIGLAV